MLKMNETSDYTGDYLKFPLEVRRRWKVCFFSPRGDEYIPLTGKQPNDHVYRLGESRIGAWLTSGHIQLRLKAIRGRFPDFQVEQLGDREAVISADLQRLDEFCSAVRARRRRVLCLSPEQKERVVARLAAVRPLRSARDGLQGGGMLPESTQTEKG